MNKNKRRKVIKKGKQFYRAMKDKECWNIKQGCGYYLAVGFLGHDPLDTERVFKIKNFSVICKPVSYTCFNEPSDMIKESMWRIVSIKNKKPVNQCSLKEIICIYHPLFV